MSESWAYFRVYQTVTSIDCAGFNQTTSSQGIYCNTVISTLSAYLGSGAPANGYCSIIQAVCQASSTTISNVKYDVSYYFSPPDINKVQSLYNDMSSTLSNACQGTTFTTTLQNNAASNSDTILASASTTTQSFSAFGPILNYTVTQPVTKTSILSTGIIVAIAIGSCVIITVIIGSLCMYCRYKHLMNINDDLENGLTQFDDEDDSRPKSIFAAIFGSTSSNAPRHGKKLTNSQYWMAMTKHEGGLTVSKHVLDNIPRIDWTDLDIATKNVEESIIGKGAFGVVVRAIRYVSSDESSNSSSPGPHTSLSKKNSSMTSSPSNPNLREKSLDSEHKTMDSSDSPSHTNNTKRIHRISGEYDDPNFLSTKDNTITKKITQDVVIKVITKSMNDIDQKYNHEKILKLALEEVATVKEAEEKIIFKNCIILVHGIAYGPLPEHLCQVMNIHESLFTVGIVMRYESGGTLDKFIYTPTVITNNTTTTDSISSEDGINNDESSPSHIYSNNNKNSNQQLISPLSSPSSNQALSSPPQSESLTLIERIRLLTHIAKGLAELHSVGVVHGDIKPENILLSGDTPPEPRLADFGLATVKSENNVVMSSLAETSHIRGTPIYCAPEMLINPYLTTVTDKVAKSSRKTDMYAFAILAWEVLSGRKPFPEIKTEAVLGAKIHQGMRPSLDLIPKNCPPKIIKMIELCWDSNRKIRKSAIECYSLLQYQYNLLAYTSYDIYLNYDITCSEYTSFMTHLFHRLTQYGYKIYYQQMMNTTVNTTTTTTTNTNNNSSSNNGSSSSGLHINTNMNPLSDSQKAVSKMNHEYGIESPTNHTTNNNNSNQLNNSINRSRNSRMSSSLRDRPVTNNETNIKNNMNPMRRSRSNSTDNNSNNADNATNPLTRKSRSNSVDQQHAISSIQSCKIVIGCINETYQELDECMSALREARKHHPPKPIIPIFLQMNSHTWTNQELIYLCQLRAKSCISYDLSKYTNAEYVYNGNAPPGGSNTAGNLLSYFTGSTNNNNNNSTTNTTTAKSTAVVTPAVTSGQSTTAVVTIGDDDVSSQQQHQQQQQEDEDEDDNQEWKSEVLKAFHNEIEKIVIHLKKLDCHPTITTSSL